MVVADQSSSRSFSFGRWTLQSDGLLLRDGKGLHLPPKELHVLRLLVGAAGSLISKEWLLDQVWPRCDVGEESLTRCIYALRKLLGRQNDYIKTIYGKGYRFVAEVVESAAISSAAALAPSLLVLPLQVQGDGCAQALRCEAIRQLGLAFGPSLRVMPAGLFIDSQLPHDRLSIVERMAPDHYLSICGTVDEAGCSLSVELVRGADHALLHGESLVLCGNQDKVLQELVALVAQRLPGLRPVASSCGSYPLALSYLNGLLALQAYTAQSLGEALLEFLHCLQLDARYSPPWCGLVDTYLAMANLGMMPRDKALLQAQKALAQARTLEPDNAQVIVRLGLLSSLQGATCVAETLFRPALLWGDRAVTRYLYAWHQWCSGQSQQAMRSVDISLSVDPVSVPALLLRARLALELDPQQGLAAIKAAISILGDGHPEINATHALILDICGDSVAALEVIENAGLQGGRRGKWGWPYVTCALLLIQLRLGTLMSVGVPHRISRRYVPHS
ncbi:Type III secretion transcriptional activator HilA [Pseudomonas chlororaphis subsp. piscium]|uniref:winged helix-turn-helix domain-containing protein n=1 Tax=Pseudomonas chlororaphis TaxID=587753 RepID=UPI000F57B5D9|nr:winged helix-turn-helix domain-containing protein [Pseudomonas chlororaphis]AZC90096.1 Type III secretion transcriptional activator HilA [Pseudomonas chlororaphis subsp. piscium]